MLACGMHTVDDISMNTCLRLTQQARPDGPWSMKILHYTLYLLIPREVPFKDECMGNYTTFPHVEGALCISVGDFAYPRSHCELPGSS